MPDLTLNIVEGDELPPLVLLFSDNGDPVDLSNWTELLLTIKSRAGYLLHDKAMTPRPDQSPGSPDRGKAEYEWEGGPVPTAGRHWLQVTARYYDLERTFPDGSDDDDGNPTQPWLIIEVAERL